MATARIRVHNGNGGITERTIELNPAIAMEADREEKIRQESVKWIIRCFDFSAAVNEALSEMDGRFSTEDFFIYFEDSLCGIRINLGHITYQDTFDYLPERYAEKIITDFCERGEGQHEDIKVE